MNVCYIKPFFSYELFKNISMLENFAIEFFLAEIKNFRTWAGLFHLKKAKTSDKYMLH